MNIVDFDPKTAREYMNLVEGRAREIFPPWDQLSRADALKILSELVAISAASLDQRLSRLPDVVVSRMPGILGLKPSLATAAEAFLEIQVKPEVEDEIIVPQQLEITADLGANRLGFRTTETGLLFNHGAIRLHHEPGRVSIGFERIPATTNLFLYVEIERPLKDQEMRWSVVRNGRPLDISTIDSTDHLSRSGVIRFFTSNLQIDRTTVDGVEAYWLHGEPLGTAVEIPVRAVVPNVLKIANLRTYHDFMIGSGNGMPNQRVKLPPGEITRSFRLKIFDGELGEAETWDEVQTLFLSTPTSRHFTIDRASGEIVFGDGNLGAKAPPGYDNIQVEYLQVTDGIRGNIPVTTPMRLKRDDWRLNKIALITDASGGRDCLASEDLVHHMHSVFRNKDRAVTLSDFRDLGLQANPRLGRLFVRERAPGIVHVSAILKPEYAPAAAQLDFTPFATDLEVLRDALESKRSLNIKLEVGAPEYRTFVVRLRAFVRKLTDENRQQIEDAICEFFSPYKAEGIEVAPGRRLLQDDLASVIERLPVIQKVRSLALEDSRTGVVETLFQLGPNELPRVQCELSFEEVSL